MAEAADAAPGSSSGTSEVEMYRSARVAWLTQLKSECGTEEEFETARTQPLWTELAISSSSADGHDHSFGNPEEDQLTCVQNQQYFQLLVRESSRPSSHPHKERFQGPGIFTRSLTDLLICEPFFSDFGGRVEAGRKIGGGGQAEIYEAVCDGEVDSGIVLKVFRREYSIADLQCQWNSYVSSGRHFLSWTDKGGVFRHLCAVKAGILLKDGRFAFVMFRYWGDLRKAIDLQIGKDKTHQTPPFPPSLTIVILFQIARGMKFLHENDILHRDLKAANVLVGKELGELKRGECIRATSFACDVADVESPEGTMGTGFWRAPEVLLALQNKVVDKHLAWTKKADVYSYAMTAYEVLSGCVPFHNRALNDYRGVIEGDRPSLPDYVDSEMRELVGRCWHSEPLMRPTFEEIQERMFKFLAKRLVYEGGDKYEWDCSAKRVIENKCCYLGQAQEWAINLGLTLDQKGKIIM